MLVLASSLLMWPSYNQYPQHIWTEFVTSRWVLKKLRFLPAQAKILLTSGGGKEKNLSSCVRKYQYCNNKQNEHHINLISYFYPWPFNDKLPLFCRQEKVDWQSQPLKEAQKKAELFCKMKWTIPNHFPGLESKYIPWVWFALSQKCQNTWHSGEQRWSSPWMDIPLWG